MRINQPRDLIGYGQNPPNPNWPNGAKLALSFVLNYEEGAERTPLNGDSHSEIYGGEFPLAPKPEGVRHLSQESLFEYGSRAGAWRLLRLFDEYQLPITIFATGQALELNPQMGAYLKESPHEVAGHGWRWIDYSDVSLDEERAHIKQTTHVIKTATGKQPLGWYTGRRSPNTRQLLVELGDYIYDSESYSDDLPYYERINGKPHLVIPYTLDCNDFRFTTTPGFSSSPDFYFYLRDTFDILMQEGEHQPKIMNVGLHGRIGGRPARALALKRFLDYVKSRDDVWICTRKAIARHWLEHHPPAA